MGGDACHHTIRGRESRGVLRGAHGVPGSIHSGYGGLLPRERALGWAARFGHRRVIELLADSGVALDAVDTEGMTALHWAAWMGHLGVVDALLARGAPLEARNRYGGTVLSATVWNAVRGGRAPDYLPMVERLLAAGARVDAVQYPSGHARIDAVLAQHRG